MKELFFIGTLFALILLGFYCMERIDCFLQENYRQQWEEDGAEKNLLYKPCTRTRGLPTFFHYGTIFLTIKHNRR